jgi:non-specific serine/threonine protein kinase
MPDRPSLETLAPFGAFGDALKYLRRRVRLSQRELSIAVGYSESQISRFESNHRPPDLATLRAQFVPALHLEGEPQLVAQFLALAAAARGEPAPASAAASTSHAREPAPSAPGRPAARPTHNLPIAITSFVGRQAEIAAARTLLRDSRPDAARCLTLTGPGGTGKTRLALQLAGGLLDSFPAGVWLVEFASLTDPAFVPHTIANVLGLREVPGYPVAQTVADFLRPRQALLVLDNCEHLVGACALLAEALLRACPHLRLLATSRESLGFLGEATLLIQPLSLLPEASGPAHAPPFLPDAVQLFLDRARAIRPDFQLTGANLLAVSQVCEQLDGLPLAIELAAACLRALSADQLAQHLDDRFRLLTAGNRAALPRHQTLSALLDWSYELLPGDERALLQRLSIFRAGWTLTAAESVCSGEDLETEHVVGLLMRLVEKSLVLVEGQPQAVRYRLLETVRLYAWSRLLESGAAQVVSARFYTYCLGLAEEAAPRLRTAEQIAWLPRLEADHANLLAALDGSLSGAADGSAAGLRLVAALGWFWYLRGFWALARDRLEAVLAHSELHGPVDPPLLARALNVLGFQCECVGYPVRAREVLEQSQALCRAHDDHDNLAYALAYLGEVLTWEIDPEQAKPPLEECLMLFRGQGQPGLWGHALSLKFLAEAVFFQYDYTRADRLLQESTRIFRQIGERWGLSNTLESHAAVALRQGDFARAQALLREGLALQQEMNYPFGWVHVFHRLGRAIYEARTQGDVSRETNLLTESLSLAQSVDHPWGMADSLRRLADQAALKGQPERAVRLLGAAEVLRESSGTPIPPYPFSAYERALAALQSALGPTSFAAAWSEGRAMNTDQALAYALQGVPPE